WDIFSPNDTTRLRKVLRTHNNAEDPVLSQNKYLSPSMLRELELQYGIKASTFVQHKGDAVFIPAGCAHQARCTLICATLTMTSTIGQQHHQRHQDCLQLHLHRPLIDHHRTCVYFLSAPHFQTIWG
ncbi:hypothetical protein EI94DRAFT_1577969, partial [Lactarius quietus]